MIKACLPVIGRAVACVVLRRRDDGPAEVLLMQRAEGPLAGIWSQVTGGIDPGEKAWQAAQREVEEETGLDVRVLYSAGWCDHFYNPAEDCVEVVPIFLAEVGPGAEVVTNYEHSTYEWLPLEAAIDRVAFHGHRVALDNVRRTFVEAEPPAWLRISTYAD
jgi:dATP pyrophosphohydrolase